MHPRSLFTFYNYSLLAFLAQSIEHLYITILLYLTLIVSRDEIGFFRVLILSLVTLLTVINADFELY
jgi:hypothetical protein